MSSPIISPSNGMGPMILRLGYDIQFQIPAPVTMVTLLTVHPSRVADLRAPDELRVEPATRVESFLDSFGNGCARFVAQEGSLRLSNSTLISDSGVPDPISLGAREIPVNELPHDALRYLYNSRYCEVDRFSMIAVELFGALPKGWSRVQAVCDWVHTKVRFGYQYARPTKTAMEQYQIGSDELALQIPKLRKLIDTDIRNLDLSGTLEKHIDPDHSIRNTFAENPFELIAGEHGAARIGRRIDHHQLRPGCQRSLDHRGCLSSTCRCHR